MQVEDYVARHAAAAEEFDRHEGRQDGGRIAYSLTHGMNTLRSLLCARIREDVENYFGKDSTIMPVSVAKSDARINGEIEVYQVAEVVAATREMGYIKSTDNWFTDWLGRLRLGEQYEQPAFRERLAYYLGRERQARELAFTNNLVMSIREANRAPLVLFRLFPLAVDVVAAIAFGDHFAAAEIRNKQLRLLPAIDDCRECHGRLLDNGERCRECGNPVWAYRWLLEAE